MVPLQVQNAEVTDSSVIPGDKNNCPLTVFSKISITSSPVSSFNSRLAASKKDSGNSYEGKKLSFFHPQPSPVYPQTDEAPGCIHPLKLSC